ncbi:MAG TPA: cupin domain-containing protein [Gaiellaceae bacterium]|nr:cupin domain-containing protein [Gaiellaceae bacterium]
MSSHGLVSHWDDVRTWRGERGHIAGTWRNLTGRASQTVGVKRIEIDAGMWSTPLHLEGAEEEIFYVLGGSGVSVQSEGEGTFGYEVRAGDCLVHLALDNAHTLQAGDDGLDVLAFGQRTYAPGATWLPRAGVAWLGETWAPVGAEEDHPWTREAAAGPPEIAEISPRPSNIVHVDDVEPAERDGATVGRRIRRLSKAAGGQWTGLSLSEVLPGKLNNPPHCHSAEEEIFVILDGAGHLLLWEPDGVVEHPVRRGSVVTRPPGTGVAHAFRAGDEPLSVLMYGTREPHDICFYPRSGRLALSGLGMIARIERERSVDYWDDED